MKGQRRRVASAFYEPVPTVEMILRLLRTAAFTGAGCTNI